MRQFVCLLSLGMLLLLAGCAKKEGPAPSTAPAHPPVPPGWKEEPCPDVKKKTFDVNDFVKNKKDVETYIDERTGDQDAEIEWTDTAEDFRVLSFVEKNSGQGGFTNGVFPTPKGRGHKSGKFLWNKIPKNSAPGMCWMFKATFEVNGIKYDPHTGGGCCT